MKTCSYCRSTVNDGDTRCPSCGAGSFKMRCGICGRAYEGETCPACRQNQMDSAALQQRAQEEAAATAKANTSLGIKTVVTIFFPFIGGYLLIAPYVKSGFKIFGIIWCAIAGLGVATTANAIPVRLISSLLCLLPIVVYIVRCHNLDADQKPPKALSIILAGVAAIAVVLGIVMPTELPELPESTSGYLSETGSSGSGAEAAHGILSFTLESTDWVQAEDGAIAVKISGKASDGKNVSEQYEAVPGQRYLTSLEAGEYEVSLLNGAPAKGDRLFKTASQKVLFDGKQDEDIVLVMALDTEAMTQKKAAEEEAAQEKAAQEAAAQAAAEAEAARIAQEQAATEAQRIAEEKAAAEAASAAAQQNERTVYVAASGKGNKYHSNPNCSGMKGAIELTISEARAQGYGPCDKCG